MRRRRLLRFAGLTGIGAFAWLAAIGAGYYILHKPFGPSEALGVAGVVADMVLAAGILTAAGGLGRRLAMGVNRDSLSGLCLQASIGVGALSLVLLAIGALGAIYPGVAWGLLAVLLVVLRRHAMDWLSAWRDVARDWRDASAFGRALGVLIAIVIGASLLEALAPPAHFDALVYHLALPQEFVRTHGIAEAAGSPYWGMPLGTEMLYTWAIALGRTQTAAVVGWMIGVTCVVGVIGLGRTFHGSAGWAAAAALLTGETLSSSLGWAYADWTAALHGAALLIALEAWRHTGDRRAAAAAGAAAAFALGTKYSAGLGLLAGAAVLVAFGGRKAWSALAVFLALAGLLAAPWLLKNWAYTGAPLFPVVGPSRSIDPAQQEFYRGETGGIGVASLLLPLTATLQGVEGAPGFAASLGPLMLGLAPGALLVRRRSAGAARTAGVFVVVGWLVWGLASLFSVQLAQTRLYYVFFPAWAVVGGAGFAGVSRIRLPRLRLGMLAQAMVVISLGLSAIGSSLAVARNRPQDPLLGLETASAYRGRRLGLYEAAMDAIADLGPGASVISLWEARGLECRPICRPDYWLDRWYLARLRSGEPDAILNQWRSEGATHLLVYRAGLDFVKASDRRYSAADWAALESLLAQLPLVERIGEAYELYRVP